jgi:hypothetical protein
MAASVPHTILLKGEWEMLQNEGVAGGTIRPGDLVSVTTAGAIVVNPTAGDAFPRKAFALEDDAQGKGIADSYAAADRVRYAECQPGNEIYAWLATTQTIVIGTPLESAGNGALRLRATTGAGVATALEAVTTTGSQARIKVKVM